MTTIPDFENIAILLLLFILLLIGFKPRNEKLYYSTIWSYLIIDKSTSVAIKGIACVFVLMGHYGTWAINSGENVGIVTTLVTHTTANVALACFMFFSGYGLSLKSNISEPVFGVWIARIKKIYLPLLYVCLCAAVLYVVIPYSDLGEKISSWYEYLHHINVDNIFIVIYMTLGLNDWYVVCILYFVSIFYFSIYIAHKFKFNLSVVLGVAMLGYIAIALLLYGPPQAHYYRYPWVFMLGHLVAVHNQNCRAINYSILITFLLSWGLLDKISIMCYVIAIVLLLIIGAVNKKYEFKGRALLYIGGLSYFFYLCHGKIGWTLLMLSEVEYKSVLLWIIVTIICSFILDKGYKYISLNRKKKL